MAAYAAAKARALTGEVAVAVVDDPGAAALLRPRPAGLVGADPERPAVPRRRSACGDGMLVDDAFGAGRRCSPVGGGPARRARTT